MRPERPPLAVWPERAFPEEGAHGWFQRLAKANGQISARTLAESMGLNGRDPKPDELLEFSRAFPGTAGLELATPVFDDMVVRLHGQTLKRGVDFSLRHTRVCPACLEEKRYHRSWFDVQAIACCPRHGCRLIGGTGTDRLAWWYPDVGITPQGADLLKQREVASEAEIAWARYVLGRMGLSEFSPCALTDAVPLHHVIEACAFFGRVGSGGPPPRGSSRARREVHASLGFEVVALGLEGARDFFEQQALDPSVRFFGRCGVYPRAKEWLRWQDANPLAEAYGLALAQAVRARGTGFRNPSNAPLRSLENHYTLKAAASELGVKPARVRQLALRLGLAKPISSPAECYALSDSDLHRIRDALRESISRSEAAKLLGLAPKDLHMLVSGGALIPLARIGGAVSAFDRFIRSEIEAALDGWRAAAGRRSVPSISFDEFCQRTGRRPGQVALEIVRGEQELDGWGTDAEGFLGCWVPTPATNVAVLGFKSRRGRTWSGVPIAEAAARLGTSPNAIVPLAKADRLRILPAESRRMAGVCPHSLEQFEREYASAQIYADLTRAAPLMVRQQLHAAGVKRLEGKGLEKFCFFAREDVLARMGPDWDLAVHQVGPCGRFWSTLREQLRSLKSSNHLVGGTGLGASIRSSDAKLIARVTICPERSWIEMAVVGDRKTSPARFGSMLNALATLRSAWPTASYKTDLSQGEISVSERFSYAGELTVDEGVRIAGLIDRRLTAVQLHMKAARRQAAA